MPVRTDTPKLYDAHAVEAVIHLIRMREHLGQRVALSRELKAIDKTLLTHDAALIDLYEKLEPLLLPPPKPTTRIGFAKEKKAVYYRTRKGISRRSV